MEVHPGIFVSNIGRLVRAVATVALLLMTASCAGAQPPPSTASSVAATAAPSPSVATPLPASPSPRPSPSPSPSAPPGGPAPPELTGAWHTALSASDQVELRLHDNLYGITRGPVNEPGKIAIQGDQIAFYSSILCKGTGTYRWSLHDGSVTFTSIEPDPCGGRSAVLDGITYTR